ncbi:MAG: type II CRISPR RNA-guided endonuclease Cas9 [Oscillospiraceae bacterium]|nr:type II CRISPR RNA-guided endonuclease Cas9 [Oscillospiraceae bacterium]
MKYGIGLDIGITSIGWVTVKLDDKENPYKIEDLGCRIFDIAENPKDGASLALPRREARSSRRRLRRRKHRIERIKQLFINDGVISENELEHLYDEAVSDIYQVRSEALDCALSTEDFIRALLHIAKRRGFKSNRRSDKNEKEAGMLLTAVSANEAEMAEKGYRTVGEMLFKDPRFAEYKRNKGENYLNTVSRKMVEEEVRTIFEKQREFGNEKASESLCEKYLDILLSQRSFEDGPGEPSKYAGNQIERMIGKCVFEKEEFRAAKAEFHTQYAILLENINHMRIGEGSVSRPLTEEERQILKNLAFSSATLNYAKIRKTLKLKETEFFTALSYGNKEWDEIEKKTKFEYLKAYHAIKKEFEKVEKGLFDNISWDELDEIGRGLTLYKTEDKLRKYLEEAGIEEKIIDIVLGISAFSGFGRLSRKACKKIIPFLEEGKKYNEACEGAGYNFRAHNSEEKQKFLPATAEELDDITNPVVRRAVSQTIKVVNAIIRKYGESPLYINVELARELSKDHDERQQIQKNMKENESLNEKVMKRLEKEFGVSNPTGLDLVKFKLWLEQDGICPYSLTAIEANRLFEPGYVDIDHVIPYSISFDDSYKNKVLVKSEENRQKGNRLPLEYLSGERKEKFIVWVNTNIRDMRKRQKLLKEKFSEEDKAQFIERNLNDTKYISRFVLNYIRDHLEFAPSEKGMKKRVRSVNGAVTAYLRKRWGINKVREDGDAHHIIDAAVIANVTDGTVKRVTDYSKMREIAYVRNEETGEDTVVNSVTGEVMKAFPQPWYGFREEVIIRSEYNNPGEVIREKKLLNYSETDIEKVKPVFVSRMPKHKTTGEAHAATVKSPKAIDEGCLIVKRPLNKLTLDKDGEIKDYYMPQSDKLLYEALKARLNEFGGNGEKAFKDIIFRKPKADGSEGPIVKKVKLIEKSTLSVPVYGGKGAADNGGMIRIDVFKVEGDGYYWVPVYIADKLKKELPNKAVIAFKDYDNWKEMKDEDFIFSLYPNDIIKVKAKKDMSFSLVNKDSNLASTKTDNDCFVYFVSGGISGGSITVINHDKTYTIASLGVKTLKSIEKYQVDALGNISKVGKEKRMGFGK